MDIEERVLFMGTKTKNLSIGALNKDYPAITTDLNGRGKSVANLALAICLVLVLSQSDVSGNYRDRIKL